MKRGAPPTALNARTGLLTPPGMTPCARANSFADFFAVDPDDLKRAIWLARLKAAPS
jgi:hypothetical protein